MSAWMIVLLAGVGSYLLRISMLVASARFRMPAIVDRTAPFAVAVAFPALAASALARHADEAGLDALPALVAVAVGFAVARRTGNGQAALLAGLPAMWLLSALPL